VQIGYWDGQGYRDLLPDGICQISWSAEWYLQPLQDPRLGTKYSLAREHPRGKISLVANGQTGGLSGRGLSNNKEGNFDEVARAETDRLGVGEGVGYRFYHSHVIHPDRVGMIQGLGGGDSEDRAELVEEGYLPLRARVSMPIFLEYDNGTKSDVEVAKQLRSYASLNKASSRVFPALGRSGDDAHGVPVYMIFSDDQQLLRVRNLLKIDPPVSRVRAWLTTRELWPLGLQGSKVLVSAWPHPDSAVVVDEPVDFLTSLALSSRDALISPTMVGGPLLIDRAAARLVRGKKLGR
jgi:hypothetical protein